MIILHECRLLGKMSERPSGIDYEFFNADRPFKDFSVTNPHGWGVGYYGEDGKARVFKQGQDNVPPQDYDFSRARGLNSKAILAHVRKTGLKSYSTKNAHPFQYSIDGDDWIFIHNGGINREALIEDLNDRIRSRLTGDGDSEVLFYLIMQTLKKQGNPVRAMEEAFKTADEVWQTKEKGYWSAFNCILTNGKKMYAYRDVNLAKKKPDEFTLCYTTPGHDKDNKSVVFSSEPLTKDEEWPSIDLGQLVIVDGNANIEKIKLI